jgi:hypothetical protein
LFMTVKLMWESSPDSFQRSPFFNCLRFFIDPEVFCFDIDRFGAEIFDQFIMLRNIYY